VDGIVFVADSQTSRYDANIESLYNLHENLEEYKLKIKDLPFVIQYNKRDMPDVIPVEELEQELNPDGYPSVEAVAIKGVGVFDTLKAVAKGILQKLSQPAS
jgi:signal recognition particle receptor subunit beta